MRARFSTWLEKKEVEVEGDPELWAKPMSREEERTFRPQKGATPKFKFGPTYNQAYARKSGPQYDPVEGGAQVRRDIQKSLEKSKSPEARAFGKDISKPKPSSIPAHEPMGDELSKDALKHIWVDDPHQMSPVTAGLRGVSPTTATTKTISKRIPSRMGQPLPGEEPEVPALPAISAVGGPAGAETGALPSPAKTTLRRAKVKEPEATAAFDVPF